MKYVKRPVQVEAFRFGFDLRPGWFREAEAAGIAEVTQVRREYGNFAMTEGVAYIDTLEGRMTVNVGDYVIQGVKGEIYPCRFDIFQETYVPVQEKVSL